MYLQSLKTTQSRSLRGFSLVELIFVLTIAAIVFGSAAYLISSPRTEKKIREAHSGIESLVLRARSMSYSYQQPFAIEIREGEIRLMPLAQPENELTDDFVGGEGVPSSLKPLDSISWPVVFKVSEDYEISVRRWDSVNFKEVDNNVVERWIHQPNNPCEPLAIQLSSLDGEATLSRSYHPLTAKAVDEEMTIGKSE